MKELHHANIIISRADCRDFVFDILIKDLNFEPKANPDFLLIEKESLGIDDVRDFGRWAIGKPLAGTIKSSLIISKAITFEAQNALLKVLEEPTLGTYIFIQLENLGNLLPTFLSRVRILDVLPTIPNEKIGQSFLSLNIKERFAKIRALSKKEDKNEIKDLIKDLEQIAYREKSSANHLKNILLAKIFVSTRGSSPKMLLEWLSCML